MQGKIQNRDERNKSVEAKGSEGDVDFPWVNKGGVGGRAGKEGDMLPSSVSDMLYYIEFGISGLQMRGLFVKLCRWSRLLVLWEEFWSLSFLTFLFRWFKKTEEIVKLGNEIWESFQWGVLGGVGYMF